MDKLVGAIIGRAINLAVHWNKIHNFQDSTVAFRIGAVAGGAGAAVSTAAIIAAGGAAVVSGAGGVIAGMFGAGTGSVLSSPIQGVGNEFYFHDPDSPVQFVNDVFFSSVTVGIHQGINASANGRSFFTGVMRNVSFADYPVITAFGDRVMAEAKDASEGGQT